MEDLNQADLEIIEMMTAADFRRTPMGGNIEGWQRDIAPDHYVIVCFGDGEAFGPLTGDGWQWASYFHDRPEDGASDYECLDHCLTAAVGFCEMGA